MRECSVIRDSVTDKMFKEIEKIAHSKREKRERQNESVCVREKEREREIEKEKERKRERGEEVREKKYCHLRAWNESMCKLSADLCHKVIVRQPLPSFHDPYDGRFNKMSSVFFNC